MYQRYLYYFKMNKAGLPDNEIHELFNKMDQEILSFEKEAAIAIGGIRNMTQKKAYRWVTELVLPMQKGINV